MKNIFLALLSFICLTSFVTHAAVTERLVTSIDDANAEGTLRVILQDACRTAGDDVIGFAKTRLTEIRINLSNSLGPLVIPENCQGRVTLEASTEVPTILDASDLTVTGLEIGATCLLNVYSDGHVIRGFTLTHSRGAGICIFGQNNLVTQNLIEFNRYGIVDSDVFQNEYPGMNGSNNVLLDNVIQLNDQGGVLVMGETTQNVEITHNIMNMNGGINIDLNVDGTTLNDLDDVDEGPNHLLNFTDHFQTFPMVPANDGSARYWGWGVALQGVRVELEGVSDLDLEAGVSYGGVDHHIADLVLHNMSFVVDPVTIPLQTGESVTSLVFDESGNTSEYAMNVRVGADADMDGIVDENEEGDGTQATAASAASHVDSDGDGVPDGVEDKNRNGVWDQGLGETAAYKADSDDDGVSDGFDDNVLVSDEDGDGLQDGDEDKNHNGIWEAYLDETSTHLADSDGDGFSDDTDTCPVVSNPGQETRYCQR